jgi:transcriptional regulator NrdR family protein
MKCRKCNSKNTRVTVTEHYANETRRYCRCLDCKAHYKTIEKYALPKRGSLPGVKQHPNCRLKGEQVGTAVLTELNILEIRRLASVNKTYVDIAKQFGIHKNTVYRIVKRKLWAHV